MTATAVAELLGTPSPLRPETVVRSGDGDATRPDDAPPTSTHVVLRYPDAGLAVSYRDGGLVTAHTLGQVAP